MAQRFLQPWAFAWNGIAQPQFRAAGAREMGNYITVGDWPPVINSGPERGVDDGQAVPMSLRTGPGPNNQERFGVGDTFLGMNIPALAVWAAIGVGAWWWIKRRG